MRNGGAGLGARHHVGRYFLRTYGDGRVLLFLRAGAVRATEMMIFLPFAMDVFLPISTLR
jgi:hypothetical protein